MNVTPVRLRLQRSKGFDLQAMSQAINGLPATRVTRPSKWGNPFLIVDISERFGLDEHLAHDRAVEFYEQWLLGTLDPSLSPGYGPPTHKSIVAELAGNNLACWCLPEETCHADVLIRLANS
ncbi:MAG: hypothetical protein JWN11_1470 [Hyphomicrobiales bacterium]|nr:hypothetical protein [Hyphomicrobiales bacterium]